MNDLELNALAEGIVTYLQTKSKTPREGIAILGMALCMLYDENTSPTEYPFAKFAADFHASLIATHADPSSTGPRLVQ